MNIKKIIETVGKAPGLAMQGISDAQHGKVTAGPSLRNGTYNRQEVPTGLDSPGFGGILAQVNPFDHGATFNHPSPQRPAGIREMINPRLPMRPYAQTRDNRITNQLVGQGQLPANQMEIYPQTGGYPEDAMTPAQYLQPQELGNGQQTLNGRYMQQRNYQGAPLSYVDQARQYLLSL